MSKKEKDQIIYALAHIYFMTHIHEISRGGPYIKEHRKLSRKAFKHARETLAKNKGREAPLLKKLKQ